VPGRRRLSGPRGRPRHACRGRARPRGNGLRQRGGVLRQDVQLAQLLPSPGGFPHHLRQSALLEVQGAVALDHRPRLPRKRPRDAPPPQARPGRGGDARAAVQGGDVFAVPGVCLLFPAGAQGHRLHAGGGDRPQAGAFRLCARRAGAGRPHQAAGQVSVGELHARRAQRHAAHSWARAALGAACAGHQPRAVRRGGAGMADRGGLPAGAASRRGSGTLLPGHALGRRGGHARGAGGLWRAGRGAPPP